MIALPLSAHHRLPALGCLAALMFCPDLYGEETFVTIHSVSGNRLQVALNAAGARGTTGQGAAASGPSAPDTEGGGGRFSGRGRRRFGGGQGAPANGSPAAGRGRGRFGQTSPKLTTITVPTTAKITVAMRERRTFEFRVMGELAGGLRHPVFTRMKTPLQARIVTRGNRITEINVVTGDTDINQTATTSDGDNIVAVKPKRPPMKRSR